ncbi:Glu/Leu/Phe/Val dehydrogenase [Candidatus Pacearchaeota archaeon]|nr:Glu/Leu/Phe/Val dehydrogenase [Candidatus Pacearchaeota archaeon]
MAEISDEDIGHIVSSLNVEDLKPQEQFEEVEPYSFILGKIFILARNLKISPGIVDRISLNDKIIEIDVPVVLESKAGGKELVKIFPGFWVEHNSVLGKYKGNVDYLSGLTMEKAKLNALNATLQNSLLDLPFGGASGGVCVDKKILTPKETERLAKNYANSLRRAVGFDKNILSSGAGCDERLMSIMYNLCKEMGKETKKSSFLGKQMQDGGIKARSNAVAAGIFNLINEALKGMEVSGIPGLQKHEDIIKKSQKEMNVVLIGFNAVEKELAFLLSSAGYKLLAVSDALGGAASSTGVHAEDAARWQRNHTSVVGLPKTVKVTNEQMLQIKADVLILASDVRISRNSMGKIKAPLIVELLPAINPMIFEELSKKRMIIPYILTSSVSAYVDYLEFLQNQADKYLERKEIDKRIEEKSKEIFQVIYNTSRQYAVNLHDASYILALQNLARRV